MTTKNDCRILRNILQVVLQPRTSAIVEALLIASLCAWTAVINGVYNHKVHLTNIERVVLRCEIRVEVWSTHLRLEECLLVVVVVTNYAKHWASSLRQHIYIVVVGIHKVVEKIAEVDSVDILTLLLLQRSNILQDNIAETLDRFIILQTASLRIANHCNEIVVSNLLALCEDEVRTYRLGIARNTQEELWTIVANRNLILRRNRDCHEINTLHIALHRIDTIYICENRLQAIAHHCSRHWHTIGADYTTKDCRAILQRLNKLCNIIISLTNNLAIANYTNDIICTRCHNRSDFTRMTAVDNTRFHYGFTLLGTSRNISHYTSCNSVLVRRFVRNWSIVHTIANYRTAFESLARLNHRTNTATPAYLLCVFARYCTIVGTVADIGINHSVCKDTSSRRSSRCVGGNLGVVVTVYDIHSHIWLRYDTCSHRLVRSRD